MNVELLVAGHCAQVERLVRRGGAWRPIDFPSLVVLVPHPGGGVALFDTGYAPRFRTATARLPYWLYRSLLPVTCAESDAVVSQLRLRGIEADDVRLVVLSHLHGDHVAGLRDFPEADVLVGEGALPFDWRSKSPWKNAVRGFVPALLPDDVDQRMVGLEPLPEVSTGLGGALRHGHDLFGDGSALVVALPGHAPGHLGLWLPRTGPDGLLLVGDAAWSCRAFTSAELPLKALQGERRSYREVLRDLARLHAERPRLLIVPSHCTASIAEARAVLSG